EVALRKPALTLGRAKELLASNLEEVSRLKELSEGLLRLAREHDDTAYAPVWLDDIAGDASNHVIKPAQAKHIAIDDAAPHVQVLGDAQSLAQAVVTLLDNAIKYSGEHSTVYIGGHTHG